MLTATRLPREVWSAEFVNGEGTTASLGCGCTAQNDYRILLNYADVFRYQCGNRADIGQVEEGQHPRLTIRDRAEPYRVQRHRFEPRRRQLYSQAIRPAHVRVEAGRVVKL